MSSAFARTGTRLVHAARKATNARPNASGAALGTVVEGDTPTLTVLLDTGQTVPQCMGPELPIGARVLCFWMNQGHDLAVIQFTSAPPIEFGWSWTVPNESDPSGRFTDTETGETWLDASPFDPDPWYWGTGLTHLVSDAPTTNGPPIGIGTAIPPEVDYAAFTANFIGWEVYTRLSEVFMFLGEVVVAVNNVNGLAKLAFITDLDFTGGDASYTEIEDGSGTDFGAHAVTLQRIPEGSDDRYRATYGAAAIEMVLPRTEPGIVGVVAAWTSQGGDTDLLSTRITTMTAGGTIP